MGRVRPGIWVSFPIRQSGARRELGEKNPAYSAGEAVFWGTVLLEGTGRELLWKARFNGVTAAHLTCRLLMF